MKLVSGKVLLPILLMSGVISTMAVQEAQFTVVERHGNLELRAYSPQLLVETVVNSSQEEAGNIAFGRLFRYISGENARRQSIAMTAPVGQQLSGEKIAMTAPVGQQPSGGGWAVSFMMPGGYTLETLPVPNDPSLRVREVPARRVAAIRYSGTWSEARYLTYKRKLEAWIRERGLTVTGDAIWARYNPPFTLWFLRRNEVLIPVAKNP